MLKYTSKSVNHHSKAYTNIKSEVEGMNRTATDALSSVAKNDDDIQRLLLESEQGRRKKLDTKVAIPEENNEEDEDPSASSFTQGISAAAEPKLDVSLQK